MYETIKITILFIFLIFLIRRKMDIEWALLLGTVFLGILFLVKPIDFLREAMKGWLNAECLSLAATVYFITVLGEFMNRTGRMEKMMRALDDLMRDGRFVAAISAALMGLMPMPGGALMSAPMVESSAKPLNVAPDRMAAINFWFRHVWEYVWPLYPGVLLTSSLFAVNITTIALVQSPLTFAAIIGGVIFLLLPIKKPPVNHSRNSAKTDFQDIFLNFWPVVVIIFVTMIPWPDAKALGIEEPRVLTRFKLLGSLFISTVIFGYINHVSRKLAKDVIIICLKKHTIMVIIAIMIFSHLIDYTNAARQIAPFFKDIGFPPIALIFLVNFIVGMLTGITQAYVGICFPIILPLLSKNGNIDLGLMQFAYMAGFLGVMLTPIHLCFALTKEYFKVDWERIYRLMAGPAVVLFLTSLIIALLWR